MDRVEYELTKMMSLIRSRVASNLADLLRKLKLIVASAAPDGPAVAADLAGRPRTMAAWLFLIIGVPAMVFLVPPLVWRRMPALLHRNLRMAESSVFGRQKLDLADDGVRKTNPEARRRSPGPRSSGWSAAEVRGALHCCQPGVHRSTPGLSFSRSGVGLSHPSRGALGEEVHRDPY